MIRSPFLEYPVTQVFCVGFISKMSRNLEAVIDFHVSFRVTIRVLCLQSRQLVTAAVAACSMKLQSMQCRIATDSISHIMHTLAVLPCKMEARQELLPSDLPAYSCTAGLLSR